MKGTIRDTRTLLDALEVELRRGHFHPLRTPRRIVGWEGPGVVFVTRLARRRGGRGKNGSSYTVVTPHAHAAGALMDRIDRAFHPLLGTDLRWDFHERIAEGITEYCAFIPPAQDSEESLLRVILREARDILKDMEDGHFPCVHFEE